MGVLSKLLNQCGKPTGRLGTFMVWTFNVHHSKLTDWGLKHVAIEKQYTILDVGCGGGRTIHKLVGIATDGKVYGIDHSEESVAASRRTNQQLIEMGRAEIRHGSVSSLPFPDHMFDVVTAVETHVFWPDVVADMREVLRVLKPGGKLCIIAEYYKGGKHDRRDQNIADWMKLPFLNVGEHADLFSRAGYSAIEAFEEYDKGWICVMGKRPSCGSASRS